MSHFETILELLYENFLVRGDDLYRSLIEAGEVPSMTPRALSYVEQDGGGHLSVSTDCKLMYKFLHLLLIAGDESSR